MKFKLLILPLLALSLAACGSKRLKTNQAKEDITRPPEIAVSADNSGTNKSIDALINSGTSETVSYEEWLKENAPKTATGSETQTDLESPFVTPEASEQ